MTLNKETLATYMEGFRKSDHPKILSCLTDDVEWVIPGAFHVRGKDGSIGTSDEGFVGSPAIPVTRLTEVDDVSSLWKEQSRPSAGTACS